jgi:hypothetical protein
MRVGQSDSNDGVVSGVCVKTKIFDETVEQNGETLAAKRRKSAAHGESRG